MFAHGLNPIPTNFTDQGIIPQLQESFLFWRVSKGGPGMPDEGGPWDTAMPEWEKFLKTQPEEKLAIYAQIKITIAYSRTGNIGEALKSAKTLAASHPDHYDVQFNLGNMLSDPPL